jgi:hypothetical protein
MFLLLSLFGLLSFSAAVEVRHVGVMFSPDFTSDDRKLFSEEAKYTFFTLLEDLSTPNVHYDFEAVTDVRDICGRYDIVLVPEADFTIHYDADRALLYDYVNSGGLIMGYYGWFNEDWHLGAHHDSPACSVNGYVEFGDPFFPDDTAACESSMLPLSFDKTERAETLEPFATDLAVFGPNAVGACPTTHALSLLVPSGDLEDCNTDFVPLYAYNVSATEYYSVVTASGVGAGYVIQVGFDWMELLNDDYEVGPNYGNWRRVLKGLLRIHLPVEHRQGVGLCSAKVPDFRFSKQGVFVSRDHELNDFTDVEDGSGVIISLIQSGQSKNAATLFNDFSQMCGSLNIVHFPELQDAFEVNAGSAHNFQRQAAELASFVQNGGISVFWTEDDDDEFRYTSLLQAAFGHDMDILASMDHDNSLEDCGTEDSDSDFHGPYVLRRHPQSFSQRFHRAMECGAPRYLAPCENAGFKFLPVADVLANNFIPLYTNEESIDPHVAAVFAYPAGSGYVIIMGISSYNVDHILAPDSTSSHLQYLVESLNALLPVSGKSLGGDLCPTEYTAKELFKLRRLDEKAI